MKSRKETAEFINSGECLKEGGKKRIGCVHFGKEDTRALMDFIYGGEPKTEDEKIKSLGEDC